MRWKRAVGALAACSVVISACGRSDGDQAKQPSAGDAHEFTVERPPTGYRLLAVGDGTTEPSWAGDEEGTDEPFVVLGNGDRRMVVSATGFYAEEGSVLSVTRGGYDTIEEFEVDGSPAVVALPGSGGRNDLVVERGPGLAVRVSSPTAATDELVEMSRRVELPGDRTRPPVITDPPADWKVLGSVDANAVVAMDASTYIRSPSVPGPTTGYGTGWVLEGSELTEQPPVVSVMVLPGDSAEASALVGLATGELVAPGGPVPESDSSTTRLVDTDAGPSIVIEQCCGNGEVAGTRTVMTHDESGALVVVVARGQTVPEVAELVAVAGSVRPTDAAGWEAMLVEATGGPGFQPDAGQQVLLQGEQNGVGWMLQTRYLPAPDPMYFGGPMPDVDECLKLSTRKLLCPTPSGGGENGSAYLGFSANMELQDIPPDFPEFAMIATSLPGTQMRVEIDGLVEVGPVAPVPGGNGSAGLVFVDLPEGSPIPVCMLDPPEPPAGITAVRISVLDAAGNELGCVGM